jgi:Cu(I)/Ag(I) efflux system membrane protein CusA/SilA
VKEGNSTDPKAENDVTAPSLLNNIVRFCLEKKLIVFLLLTMFVFGGIIVAPFDWDTGSIPHHPVPVDAIPDIGENQQIVFTEWMGRSPQDVEDQITYPLTVALLGIPEVKTVRSYSFFGFSSIYVIFKESPEFYWTRTRILEKLNSLPSGTLPEGVAPALGPDATALGQVYWYTLEGRDGEGKPAPGWDPQELRSIQDWYVRYGLTAVDGVAEVASVGGYVKEYQIDVDPDAMRAYGVTLEMVFKAVRNSNLDVGARTIEVNKAEYVIRGLGFIENLDDLRETVVKATGNVPVTLAQIGTVELGPALRRGALDKEGAEAVGGVVTVRYGANPLAAIKELKKKIESLKDGMPEKTLADGRISKVTIVPFYDRTGLIDETLGTLNTALSEEILVTCIVVIIIVMHLRSSLLIAMMLPMTVLVTFIAMKLFKVDANIVALSGIAIAIGTIVDMGIVVCENILKHLDTAKPGDNRLELIYRATCEVGSAVLTAVTTTVLSFLPVFFMIGAEGKMFRPLAFTKTFALIASIIVALTLIPPIAHILFSERKKQLGKFGRAWPVVMLLAALALPLAVQWVHWWMSGIVAALAIYQMVQRRLPDSIRQKILYAFNFAVAFLIAVALANSWMPLGPEKGIFNILFVVGLIGGLLAFFLGFMKVYGSILGVCLRYKGAFLTLILSILVLGLVMGMGLGTVFGFMPESVRKSKIWITAAETFPGLSKEFMPALDEGSFLFMPTTMPHASIGEAMDVMQLQDKAIKTIPEVESVVGKLGRVESPLDPAPVSMFEAVVLYKPEYITNAQGARVRYRFDKKSGDYVRDGNGELIEDRRGRPYRQWRDEIKTPEDIWQKIVEVTELPGTTSAPKLQPIETRLIMLQTGMRAPMGLKVYGPDLETIEKVGIDIERLLREVPSIEGPTVFADRIVGKPYVEIDIDRKAIARYGISIKDVQDVIEVAVGGRQITTTVEGRERYPVRVRYQRELRDSVESLGGILIAGQDGAQIPIRQLAEINYIRGPQAIKSEDTFLVGYVVFDMKPGFAEVDVVEAAARYLDKKKVSGELVIPKGVTYKFTGNYENQIRAEKTLIMVVPIALLLIFIVIYMQFNRLSTTLLVFSGIFIAWSGGFIMIWLYNQPWFLDFEVLDMNMRELFQIRTINLSVAVWVGFLALFGIATDDGVLMGTYLKQLFGERKPRSVEDIRATTVEAAVRRNRPAMMTTATTVLALLPVLTSTGRGSDVMVPMAIPSFGGMVLAVVTVLVVPTLYCWIEERKVKSRA